MKYLYVLLSCLFIFAACIGEDILDDYVDPVLRITNPIDSISVDSTFQYTYQYFNNIGLEENVTPVWSSTDTALAEVSSGGILRAKKEGEVAIISKFSEDGTAAADTNHIYVAANPSETVMNIETKRGTIQTTSSYVLKGSFTVATTDRGIRIDLAEDFEASTALPLLVLFLSNNPNSINGALRVGDVKVFKGAHSISVENVGLNDYSYLLYYCEPFNVKVGDGLLE